MNDIGHTKAENRINRNIKLLFEIITGSADQRYYYCIACVTTGGQWTAINFTFIAPIFLSRIAVAGDRNEWVKCKLSPAMSDALTSVWDLMAVIVL